MMIDKIRVWDPLLRIFHWSLVACFALAWITAEEAQPIHEVAGYAVAALVAFRLLWGIVGPRRARFSQFLRSPRATLAYINDVIGGHEARYVGHNPAGAAMIVAILLTLSGTAFSGWLMADPDRLAGLPDMPQIVAPAFADGHDDHIGGRGEAEDALKEVHEALAGFMVLLVTLHLGGVILASSRQRENLARAMVTGDKRAPGPGDIS